MHDIRDAIRASQVTLERRYGLEPEATSSYNPPSLTWEQYTSYARSTRGVFNNGRSMLDLAVVGMGGEVGELLNLYEKLYIHEHPYRRETFVEELGDLLWYLTLACDWVGISLGEVMFSNIQKLARRYPKGFTSEDSVARVDHRVPAPSTTPLIEDSSGLSEMDTMEIRTLMEEVSAALPVSEPAIAHSPEVDAAVEPFLQSTTPAPITVPVMEAVGSVESTTSPTVPRIRATPTPIKDNKPTKVVRTRRRSGIRERPTVTTPKEDSKPSS